MCVDEPPGCIPHIGTLQVYNSTRYHLSLILSWCRRGSLWFQSFFSRTVQFCKLLDAVNDSVSKTRSKTVTDEGLLARKVLQSALSNNWIVLLCVWLKNCLLLCTFIWRTLPPLKAARSGGFVGDWDGELVKGGHSGRYRHMCTEVPLSRLAEGSTWVVWWTVEFNTHSHTSHLICFHDDHSHCQWQQAHRTHTSAAMCSPQMTSPTLSQASHSLLPKQIPCTCHIACMHATGGTTQHIVTSTHRSWQLTLCHKHTLQLTANTLSQAHTTVDSQHIVTSTHCSWQPTFVTSMHCSWQPTHCHKHALQLTANTLS